MSTTFDDTTTELTDDDHYRVKWYEGDVPLMTGWLSAERADAFYDELVNHSHIADIRGNNQAIERKSDGAIVEGHWS